MGHFTYKHLPAKGIGDDEKTRPYVTGGLGSSYLVLVFLDGSVMVMTIAVEEDRETVQKPTVMETDAHEPIRETSANRDEVESIDYDETVETIHYDEQRETE